MRKLFLHIGMHKTGSSSIQHTLASLPQEGNVIYANLGEFKNHSVPMNGMFLREPEKFKIFKKQSRSRNQIQHEMRLLKKHLVSQFTQHANQNFIISGEGIVSLNEDELIGVRSFFEEFFDQIIVCAYIRAPISFMESAFQQRLKTDVVSFDINGPKYRNKFEKFEKVFGIENIHYWLFERTQLKNQCVVQDFCERTGFDLNNTKIVHTNEGLSLNATAMLYKARKDGFEVKKGLNGQRNHALLQFLSTMKDEKLHFGEKFSTKLIADNKKDIEWMESRLGLPFKESRQDNESAINSEKDLLNRVPEIITPIFIDLTFAWWRKQEVDTKFSLRADSITFPNVFILLFLVGFADKTLNNKFFRVFVRFFSDWKSESYQKARRNLELTYLKCLSGIPFI